MGRDVEMLSREELVAVIRQLLATIDQERQWHLKALDLWKMARTAR